LLLCDVKFFGLLFGALGCLVEDGVFHKVEKDATSMHQTLAIDDSNRVVDSITTLIVVVEGQDIQSEVVLLNALIDLSKLMDFCPGSCNYLHLGITCGLCEQVNSSVIDSSIQVWDVKGPIKRVNMMKRH
jgi:hypothetical protein